MEEFNWLLINVCDARAKPLVIAMMADSVSAMCVECMQLHIHFGRMVENRPLVVVAVVIMKVNTRIQTKFCEYMGLRTYLHIYVIIDYENCANNPDCAKRTIRAYMDRYKQVRVMISFIFLLVSLSAENLINTIFYNLFQDCNGDSQVNCFDFFEIMMFGPSGCLNRELSKSQQTSLHNCL